MTGVSTRGIEALPAPLALHAEQVCQRFESAWRAGPRPRLEDFLQGAAEAERTPLLRELVEVEIEGRLARGEAARAEEYQQRFPALDPAWLADAVADPPLPAGGGAAAAVPSMAPGAAVPALAAGGGRSLGDYELLGELARGGMGVVYRARDVALGREVAVKVLLDRFPAGGLAAHRFLGEARITGQLQHPGIPAVHQVGTLPDGRPYLAMKLIKGRTLDQVLRERPNPAAERGRLLAVFAAVCQAVGYAHAHRVIHRDLKPANVMVGAFGEVLVMDWGLAKVLPGRGGGGALSRRL
jgi:hypothetical protein